MPYTLNGIELAVMPDLLQREQKQRMQVYSLRQAEAGKVVITDFLNPKSVFETPEQYGAQMGLYPNDWMNRVHKTIEERRNLLMQTNILDVGAMLATSLLETASSHADSLECNLLHLYATNVAFNPRLFSSAQLKERFGVQRNRWQQLWDAYSDNIDFRVLMSEELYEIGLPKQNIILENNALAHSLVPELDLPRIGSMLAKGGYFILGSMNPMDNNKGNIRPDKWMQRILAFQVGIENLERIGLKRERHEEYNVFLNP